jgi:hypothetical protein
MLAACRGRYIMPTQSGRKRRAFGEETDLPVLPGPYGIANLDVQQLCPDRHVWLDTPRYHARWKWQEKGSPALCSADTSEELIEAIGMGDGTDLRKKIEE